MYLNLQIIEWRARQTGAVTYQSQIRDDIDDCIKLAFNFGNFIYLMETRGYEIKQGKYLSIKPYEGKHFSRGYKLGNKYTLENIRRRIDGKDLAAEFIKLQSDSNKRREYIPYQKLKKGSFKALVLHYMYLLGQIKTKDAPQEVVTICKEDLKRFDELVSNINFIVDRQFKTVEQVERHIDSSYIKLKSLKLEQKRIKEKYFDKEPLFKALRQLKFYEKAHQLYVKGYHEMKEENELYISAREVFGKEADDIPEYICNLEADYNQYQNDLSINNIDIQKMKTEVKKSKGVLKFHEQAGKRINQIDEYRVNVKQNNDLSAKEMARKLNER